MARPIRKRWGFTLVELLVVISIIGMLMALLLPAVQAARESGRSNTCRNNMRNLGLAIQQYETNRREFPGYVEDIDRTAAISDNDNRSWAFVILPYLDHRAVFEQYKNNATPNQDINLTLEVMLCPSNPPDGSVTSPMAYVVNSGQVDTWAQMNIQKPWDYAANGVFHRHDPQSPGIPVIAMTTAYLNAGDGLDTTLMLSENVDLQKWTGGYMNASVPEYPLERWTGFCYHEADGTPGTEQMSPPDPMGINVRPGQSKKDPNFFIKGYMRPSSMHPGAVNMMFCGGNVRAINDTISYGVFQALMTARGKDAMYASQRNVPLPPAHAAKQIVDESQIN